MASRLRAAGCVFAEDEARLLVAAARTATELEAMTSRRVGGEPLELVLGYAEFCGIRIGLAPGVFVPRRRTEFLVRLATERIGRNQAGGVGAHRVLVDLCCGSGAIAAAALTLARSITGSARLEAHAADLDPAAVACAMRNLGPLGGHVYQGDLFRPLPAALVGRVSVLVANVPYVPTREIELLPAEAREHESRLALDGGADGLDVLRRVAAESGDWLAPGGVLLTEVAERQAAAAARIVSRSGLRPRIARDRELGAVVLIGTTLAKPADEGGAEG